MKLNFHTFIKKMIKNYFDMKFNSNFTLRTAIFAIVLIAVSQTATVNAQQSIGFGVHVNPLFGWFTSDNSDVTSKGASAGFNFGLTFNRYFWENYAFSAGISLITAGGSLAYSDTTVYRLRTITEVLPGSKIKYEVKYLTFPIGMKLRSNQIGYFSLFTDIGLDPKFALGGKLEIPSHNIDKENANKELVRLSIGYHVTGGIEYSLGGNTSVNIGVNFDNNFTNIIKNNNNRPSAKILHKMFGLRLGLNF